jgi:hypothetical protein
VTVPSTPATATVCARAGTATPIVYSNEIDREAIARVDQDARIIKISLKAD